MEQDVLLRYRFGDADTRWLAEACSLAERCPHAVARCHAEAPELRALEAGRQVACHRAEEIAAPLSLPA